MRQQLRLHPDSRSVAVAQIEVEIARPRADILVLSYIVTGNMGGIRMPLATAGGRSDELWRPKRNACGGRDQRAANRNIIGA